VNEEALAQWGLLRQNKIKNVDFIKLRESKICVSKFAEELL
jgi:hypothetical protein